MNRDRLAWWQQQVVQYMRDGMDPGLIAAVLFYHWMETLYMDDILQEELEPERIQAIGERLYETLRTDVCPSPPGESEIDVLLQNGQMAIYEQISRMYPRRILHQRDIDRWVQRLSDELDNTMVEVAQWAGRLDAWRPVVWALWWSFKSCLENVATPLPPLRWVTLQDLMDRAERLVSTWLKEAGTERDGSA
jgi:hypothetical protein